MIKEDMDETNSGYAKQVGGLKGKKILQLENYKEVPDIEIEKEAIDQNQRKIEIVEDFRLNKILKFNRVFDISHGRENVIVSFLIVLDMIKDGSLNILENNNEIEFEYKGI